MALSYVLLKTQTILSIKKLDVFVLLIEVSSLRLFWRIPPDWIFITLFRTHPLTSWLAQIFYCPTSVENPHRWLATCANCGVELSKLSDLMSSPEIRVGTADVSGSWISQLTSLILARSSSREFRELFMMRPSLKVITCLIHDDWKWRSFLFSSLTEIPSKSSRKNRVSGHS